MKKLALVSATLAAATSVVGLEFGNIPIPRQRRDSRSNEVGLDKVHYSTVYEPAEQVDARAAELAEHTRKIEAAKAKRARKAEKLKTVAAKGGIETVPAPTAADPGPIKIAAKKIKRGDAQVATYAEAYGSGGPVEAVKAPRKKKAASK